jgi:hypothetical protein
VLTPVGRRSRVTLPPGLYTLTVHGSLIGDAATGLPLDAAGNLRAGSDASFFV